MKKRRRKTNKNIIWIVLALVLVGLSRTELNGKFETFFKSLAENDNFIVNAISLELGVIPSNANIHSSLAEEEETQHVETEVVDPLVSESAFTPQKTETPTTTTPSNISELTIKGSSNGYVSSGNVYVKNDSGLSFDLASMLKNPKKITVSGSSPQVMILHTHGSESYTPDENNKFTTTDNDRTQDTNYNVVRVGDEITKTLESMGIGVVHCREILDVPSYSNSYNRALEKISAQMKKTPNIKVIIDVHRDAMIAKDGTKYKVVTDINGTKAAQLMLVMGTNAGGLTHDNWKTNLNFAASLQSRLNKTYPNLMRPINLRAQRFNEHVTPGSMILEVGTSGNSLDEALVSARAFARELGATLTGK